MKQKNVSMKKLALIMTILFTINVQAQEMVYDPRLERVSNQLVNLQTQSKVIVEDTKKATEQIQRISNDYKKIQEDYYNSLKTISTVVKNALCIKNAFDTQKKLVTEYANNLYLYDEVLSTKEKGAVRSYLKTAVSMSGKVLDKIRQTLINNSTQMTDKERLDLLISYETEMEELLAGVRYLIRKMGAKAKHLKAQKQDYDLFNK